MRRTLLEVERTMRRSPFLKAMLCCRLLTATCVVLMPFTASAYQDHSVSSTNASSDSEEVIGLREAYVDCLEGGGTTTAAILKCTHEEFVFQDKRLNGVYKRLMAKLDASAKQKLREEERKWIDSKETRCSLNPDAGTADQISVADCVVRDTARRAADLERRAK